MAASVIGALYTAVRERASYLCVSALNEKLIPLAAAKPRAVKRDDSITWGPLIELGPSDGVEIISVVSTIYPSNMPSTQAGGLYNWIGINNATETGDLVQGIVGSYIHGQSECSGADADKLWCISAEVYGEIEGTDNWNQWVGDLRTLETTPADGVTFNYTLINSKTGLWLQEATNAKTGDLLATFNKTSPQMTMFNTAVECQSCTPPVDPQYWINTTIRLSGADTNFGNTIYQSNHASNTPVTTADGGITWKIANVTIPVVTPIAD